MKKIMSALIMGIFMMPGIALGWGQVMLNIINKTEREVEIKVTSASGKAWDLVALKSNQGAAFLGTRTDRYFMQAFHGLDTPVGDAIEIDPKFFGQPHPEAWVDSFPFPDHYMVLIDDKKGGVQLVRTYDRPSGEVLNRDKELSQYHASVAEAQRKAFIRMKEEKRLKSERERLKKEDVVGEAAAAREAQRKVFIKDEEERLNEAAKAGDVQAAKAILDKKMVGPNIKDAQGNTPLHYAKTLEMVQFLVERGANVNAQSADGNTPLHTLASGSKKLEHGGVIMAEYLILHGADRTKQNKRDQTPFDVAKKNKRVLLLPVLDPRLPRPIERGIKDIKELGRAVRNIRLKPEPGSYEDMPTQDAQGFPH